MHTQSYDGWGVARTACLTPWPPPALPAPSQDAEVLLTYTQSYDGWGVARMACVSGCSCNETRANGAATDAKELTSLAQYHK